MNNNTIDDPYIFLVKIEGDDRVKIYANEFCIYKDYIIYDIAIQNDEVFQNSKFLYRNIRKPQVVLQRVDENNRVISTLWGIKGIKPFLPLLREFLEFNLDNNKTFDTFQQMKPYADWHSIIFEYHDNNSFQSGISLFKIPTNGEIVAITYKLGWLIASGTVSLFAEFENDLNYYLPSRFLSLQEMGHAWFQSLKNLTLESLQKDLTNRTIIGEYSKIDKKIYWFSMIEHDKDEISIHPQKAYKFFHYYMLETLPLELLGTFTDKHLMNEILLKLFDEINQAEISKTESCKIFFVKSEDWKSRQLPSVISTCEILSIESQIYRLIKKYLLDQSKLQQKKQFEEAIYNLCQFNKPPRPLEFYFSLADIAFDYIKTNPSSRSTVQFEWHIFFNSLLQTLKRKGKELVISENLDPIDLNQNTIIALLPLGLPGMGKSVLFSHMQRFVREQYNNVKVRIIEYKEEEVFQSQIKDEVASLYEIKNKERYTVSFLAIHRNYYSLASMQKDIDYLQSLETSQWLKIHTIAIVPECYREFHLWQNKKIPFSFNFIINCINRILKEKNTVQLLLEFSEKLLGFIDCNLDSTIVRRLTGADSVVHYPFIQENEQSDSQYCQILEEDLISTLKSLEAGKQQNDQLELLLDSINNNKPDEMIIDEAKLTHECGHLLKQLIKQFCISKIEYKQQKSVKFQDQQV